MSKPSQKVEMAVWAGLVLIILVIAGAFVSSRMTSSKPLPVIGQISDFTLTNQNGAPLSLSSLRGRVWVADVVFTRCPGPCARMSHHLSELQSQLPVNQPVRLVTLTSDPDFDTPPVLKKYAARFGADSNCWSFLTGPKPEIRRLEVNDFKFVVVEKTPEKGDVPNDLFIHSTWFVLVDKQARVRGWTDAQGSLHAYFDSEDPAARAEILSAINQLLRETPNPPVS